MAELLQDLAEEAFHPIPDPWLLFLVRSPAGGGPSRPGTPGSVGHSTAARGRLAVTVEAVKHRHQIACQEERGRHTADHDDGQRLRRLAADLGRYGRGQETQHGRQRGHHHRPHPFGGTLHDRFMERQALGAKGVEIRDQQQAVHDGDPEE